MTSADVWALLFHAQYFLVNLLYTLFYLNLHHLIPGYGHPNKHKVYRVSIHTTLKKKYETLSIHTFCSTKYVFKAFVTFLQMFNYILHQRLVYIPKHIWIKIKNADGCCCCILNFVASTNKSSSLYYGYAIEF